MGNWTPAVLGPVGWPKTAGRNVGLTVGSLAVLELALEAVGEDGLDIGSRKLAN